MLPRLSFLLDCLILIKHHTATHNYLPSCISSRPGTPVCACLQQHVFVYDHSMIFLIHGPQGNNFILDVNEWCYTDLWCLKREATSVSRVVSAGFHKQFSQVVWVYVHVFECVSEWMDLSLHLFASVHSGLVVLTCACIWACVCEREDRKKNQCSYGGKAKLLWMAAHTLSRAKCHLTAKFNDIYFQATHFQTCSGSVLSAGPQLSTMPQAWWKFTWNVSVWGMFTARLMSACMK